MGIRQRAAVKRDRTRSPLSAVSDSANTRVTVGVDEYHGEDFLSGWNC